SPADMLRLRGGRFAAFVTDLGGPTSHTAIVARSMGVPAVVALGNVRDLVRDGDTLVVDGAAGVVLVNPAPRILQEYRNRQVSYAQERAELALLRDERAVTLDGIDIVLNANIELPDEAAAALAAGADGIGLFRSEFLFMGRQTLPDEEEQYQAYASVARIMGGRPVTIRTLDLGADKTLDDEATVATNPALGQRAIRYCLARPEMFATQLRAILRASAHGHARARGHGGPGRHRGRPPRTGCARPGLRRTPGGGRHGRGAGHRDRHRAVRPGAGFSFHRNQRPDPVHPGDRPRRP